MEIIEMIKIMMFWVLVKSYCDLLWCIQDYYIITSLRSCPLPIIPNCRLHHHMNHHLWFHSLNSFAYILYFDFLPWNLSCAIFFSFCNALPGCWSVANKGLLDPSDSSPPFLTGNLPFPGNISSLPFSLDILPVFETLPCRRKILFSLLNQSFLARFSAVFLWFLSHFYLFGFRARACDNFGCGNALMW